MQQLQALSATFSGRTYTPDPEGPPGLFEPPYISVWVTGPPADNGWTPQFVELLLYPDFSSVSLFLTFSDIFIVQALVTTPAPEPATWLFLGAGFGTLALLRRRRRGGQRENR